MIPAVFTLLNSSDQSPSIGADLGQQTMGVRKPHPFDYQQTRDNLTKCAGIGQETPNYTLALQFLNKDLSLGLEPFELDYLSTLMNGLSAIRRFSGDLHMSPNAADNTAIHTLHCLPLIQEMFNRAGLLEPGTAVCKDPNMEMLRLAIMGGLIFHDTGEFLVEPSSVASRSNVGKGIEGDGELSGSHKVSLELYVARIAHTLGFVAAQAAHNEEFSQLAELNAISNQIRTDTIGHLSNGGSEAVTNALTSHLPHLINLLGALPPLTDVQKNQVEKTIEVMQLIDAPEDFFEMAGIDPDSYEGLYLRFFRGCVKTTDSNQGNRFFESRFTTLPSVNRIRVFGPESNSSFLSFNSAPEVPRDSIPIAYADGNRMLNNMRFSEKHLAPLWEAVQKLTKFKEIGGFSSEIELSKTIISSIYLSFVEMAEHSPAYIMRFQEKNPEVTELFASHAVEIKKIQDGVYGRADAHKVMKRIIDERKHYINELHSIWSDPGKNLTADGPQVITNKELQALYLAAAENFWIGNIDSSHPISRGIALVDGLTNKRYKEVQEFASKMELHSREEQTRIREKYAAKA